MSSLFSLPFHLTANRFTRSNFACGAAAPPAFFSLGFVSSGYPKTLCRRPLALKATRDPRVTRDRMPCPTNITLYGSTSLHM
jgi:hypothetical protein